MDRKNEEQKKKENLWFFNAWASWYDYSGLSLWLRYVQKKVVDSLEIKARNYLLDASCGTGELLRYLQKKVPLAKLYGLDLSSKMLKVTKKKLGSRAILKEGSVERLPFASRSFDFVFSTEAFHHYLHPEKALPEFHRVLMPKGKLVIADLNFSSAVVHKLFKWLEPGHVDIYSPKQFKEMFEDAGFKVLSQKRVGMFAIITVGAKERGLKKAEAGAKK